MKLPPPWLRNRDSLERARERAQLAAMRALERLLVAAGFKVRPKQ